MNFKGHFIGGSIASTLVTAFLFFKAETFGIQPSPRLLSTAFLCTFFFSLFPDIDTQSIIQKWFYRALFGVFLYLYAKKDYQLASLLAVLGVLPLLSHHRAWTHHPVSVVFFPVFMAGFYEYSVCQCSIWHSFSLEKVFRYLNDHAWLVMSSSVGWGTHLILDTRWVRKRRRKRR